MQPLFNDQKHSKVKSIHKNDFNEYELDPAKIEN